MAGRGGGVMLLLAMISLTCLLLPAEAKECRPLMPGMDKMRRGVDITTLDITPVSKTVVAKGWKSPVIEYTCDKNRVWKAKDGTAFAEPDQVWQKTQNNIGWAATSVTVYKAYDEVRKSMSTGVGLDATYMQWAFSGSFSYKNLQSTITNSSRYVTDVTAFVGARTVELPLSRTGQLKLGPSATSFLKVEGIGSYSKTPKLYQEFIEQFGTHYFQKGTFGGFVRKVFKTEESYFVDKKDKDIKAAAKISFLPFLSVGGQYSKSSKYLHENFEKTSEHHIMYLGGNTNLMSSNNGLKDWQPTVDKLPWLFGGKLKPLSDLVSWDKETKQGLKDATDQHVFRAYLREVRRLVLAAQSKLQNLKNPQLKLINTRVNTLSRNKILNIDSVKRLKNDIDPPDWFTDSTNLCLRWTKKGGLNNMHSKYLEDCGGGADRTLCAKPNDMTKAYIDHATSSGCMLQWGIVSSNPEPWFKDVKLCFHYNPERKTANSEECGSGKEGTLCAPVNSYTTAFLDNSFRSVKGCSMQWKLQVPESAPLWMHTVEICLSVFGKESDNCNDGKHHRAAKGLCALANQWTEVYKDDTAQRRGACHMRWGLKRLI